MIVSFLTAEKRWSYPQSTQRRSCREGGRFSGKPELVLARARCGIPENRVNRTVEQYIGTVRLVQMKLPDDENLSAQAVRRALSLVILD